MMLATCLAVPSAQQGAPQPPLSERIAALLAKGGYSGTERPLSASVIGQFVSWRPGEIGLMVLWRGAERWYYASPRSGGGGGSADSYMHSSVFGSVRTSLTFNQTDRIATVNGVDVALSQGENVLLVDGVDGAKRPSVTAIRVDLSSTVPAADLRELLAASNLAAIVRRSTDIASFLQCDGPGNAGPAYVCGDLEAK
jgi:hypothetical protein